MIPVTACPQVLLCSAPKTAAAPSPVLRLYFLESGILNQKEMNNKDKILRIATYTNLILVFLGILSIWNNPDQGRIATLILLLTVFPIFLIFTAIGLNMAIKEKATFGYFITIIIPIFSSVFLYNLFEFAQKKLLSGKTINHLSVILVFFELVIFSVIWFRAYDNLPQFQKEKNIEKS